MKWRRKAYLSLGWVNGEKGTLRDFTQQRRDHAPAAASLNSQLFFTLLIIMAGTIAEVWWGNLLDTYGEATVATLGTFIFHESVYFGLSFLFWALSQIPAVQKYKIQPNKPLTWEAHWRCFKQLAFSHLVFQLPMMLLFHYMAPIIGMSVGHKLPSWSSIAFSVVFSFLVEDFYFYWIHRLLHWGVWYKYIHKIHHEYASPFGMVAEYAHPLETLILGFGTMLGPFLSMNHIFSMYVFLFFRLCQTIEHHCGYEYPWSPSKWLPIWSGAAFHDFHHETFTGNYASSFNIWDRVFGTDVKYKERLANRKVKSE